MFEEYLNDASDFINRGNQAALDEDTELAKRYYRAAVFYAFGAIEAFVNYIADSFAKAESLNPHERAFINDKRIEFATNGFKVVERSEYHKLEDKLKFLIRRFKPTFDFNAIGWSQILEFKTFRDSLVHPKNADDIYTPSDYQTKLRSGMKNVIEVMNEVSLSVFQRPLRQRILDLKPT